MSSFEAHLGSWLSAPARAAAPTDDADEQSEERVITALVQQYASSLYRVAFSVVRNSAEAEDAVQETFMRVLKNKALLPTIRNPRVWLVRITWNVVLDRKRRAKVRPQTDDIDTVARTLASVEPTSEAAVIAAQGHARILRLIDTLPDKERQALLLSAIEQLSTAEIAAVVRTSESSVRSRLFRARRTLARLLADERAGRGEESKG